MLDATTPVILTYNEASNVGRTLSNLSWANEIIVVDSGSTDGTVDILRSNPRVRLFMRNFESHKDQWLFATSHTDIKTPWILRLDADYQIPPALRDEIARLDPDGAANGYRIGFDYAIYSKKLLGSLYPPKTVLLRQGFFVVLDSGHTEAWMVEGPVEDLKERIVHDDWKTMPVWINAQTNYMRRELAFNSHNGRGLAHWFRSKPPLMIVAVFFYCLFLKGLIFNGRRGIMYTLQRMVAEGIYGLLLLEQCCRSSVGPDESAASAKQTTAQLQARSSPGKPSRDTQG